MAFKNWKRVTHLKIKNSNGFELESPDTSLSPGISMDTHKVKNQAQNEITQKQKSENRKIKNAQKKEVDGIVFDSLLEAQVYERLKESGLPFVYQVEFILLEAFTFQGKQIQPWRHRVDFEIIMQDSSLLVEVKGFANDVYPYKLKMLRRFLATEYEHAQRRRYILFVHTKKELDALMPLVVDFHRTASATALDILLDLYAHPDSEATRKRKRQKANEYKMQKRKNQLDEWDSNLK